MANIDIAAVQGFATTSIEGKHNVLFARTSKHQRDRLPWREPQEIWSNQAGFDELYARLERVEELWPEAEYVMQDRLTGQHWLLTCNGRLGDKIAPKLNPISWPMVARGNRETWLERLTDAWSGPPWVRPRNVWQYNKHFQALRERLDLIDDVNIRESLYRDRETDQLWMLWAVDGGGDMFPGPVNCFKPVTEQTDIELPRLAKRRGFVPLRLKFLALHCP